MATPAGYTMTSSGLKPTQVAQAEARYAANHPSSGSSGGHSSGGSGGSGGHSSSSNIANRYPVYNSAGKPIPGAWQSIPDREFGSSHQTVSSVKFPTKTTKYDTYSAPGGKRTDAQGREWYGGGDKPAGYYFKQSAYIGGHVPGTTPVSHAYDNKPVGSQITPSQFTSALKKSPLGIMMGGTALKTMGVGLSNIANKPKISLSGGTDLKPVKHGVDVAKSTPLSPLGAEVIKAGVTKTDTMGNVIPVSAPVVTGLGITDAAALALYNEAQTHPAGSIQRSGGEAAAFNTQMTSSSLNKYQNEQSAVNELVNRQFTDQEVYDAQQYLSQNNLIKTDPSGSQYVDFVLANALDVPIETMYAAGYQGPGADVRTGLGTSYHFSRIYSNYTDPASGNTNIEQMLSDYDKIGAPVVAQAAAMTLGYQPTLSRVAKEAVTVDGVTYGGNVDPNHVNPWTNRPAFQFEENFRVEDTGGIKGQFLRGSQKVGGWIESGLEHTVGRIPGIGSTLVGLGKGGVDFMTLNVTGIGQDYAQKGNAAFWTMAPFVGTTGVKTGLYWNEMGNWQRALGIGSTILPFAAGPLGKLAGSAGRAVGKVPVLGSVSRGVGNVGSFVGKGAKGVFTSKLSPLKYTVTQPLKVIGGAAKVGAYPIERAIAGSKFAGTKLGKFGSWSGYWRAPGAGMKSLGFEIAKGPLGHISSVSKMTGMWEAGGKVWPVAQGSATTGLIEPWKQSSTISSGGRVARVWERPITKLLDTKYKVPTSREVIKARESVVPDVIEMYKTYRKGGRTGKMAAMEKEGYVFTPEGVFKRGKQVYAPPKPTAADFARKFDAARGVKTVTSKGEVRSATPQDFARAFDESMSPGRRTGRTYKFKTDELGGLILDSKGFITIEEGPIRFIDEAAVKTPGAKTEKVTGGEPKGTAEESYWSGKQKEWGQADKSEPSPPTVKTEKTKSGEWLETKIEARLVELGYSPSQINVMTGDEAWKIIADNATKTVAPKTSGISSTGVSKTTWTQRTKAGVRGAASTITKWPQVARISASALEVIVGAPGVAAPVNVPAIPAIVQSGEIASLGLFEVTPSTPSVGIGSISHIAPVESVSPLISPITPITPVASVSNVMSVTPVVASQLSQLFSSQSQQQQVNQQIQNQQIQNQQVQQQIQNQQIQNQQIQDQQIQDQQIQNQQIQDQLQQQMELGQQQIQPQINEQIPYYSEQYSPYYQSEYRPWIQPSIVEPIRAIDQIRPITPIIPPPIIPLPGGGGSAPGGGGGSSTAESALDRIFKPHKGFSVILPTMTWDTKALKSIFGQELEKDYLAKKEIVGTTRGHKTIHMKTAEPRVSVSKVAKKGQK